MKSTTNGILVVLDVGDPDTTLQAVIQETDVSDAEYHLLLVYPMAEYEERRRARIDAGVSGPYTLEQLAEEARRIAQRVGYEHLDPDADEFDAMGAVGDRPDCIRRTVRNADYRRIYIAEPSHSIWQQLLGTETLSTELTRVLPGVVSVVSVDDVLDSTDDDSDTETVLDPDAEPTTRSHET